MLSLTTDIAGISHFSFQQRRPNSCQCALLLSQTICCVFGRSFGIAPHFPNNFIKRGDTQQFNTTTSRGRLTLNILLSFAQFEREVTGERIRDKIAAGKAKGMWMGGTPPLGYHLQERKLVVNQSEASLVRSIFARYAEIGSAAQLACELQIEGHTTKAWVTQNGRQRERRVIDQQVLFAMLRNRLYLGETTHKGQSFTGQHEAIVTPELWAAVHEFVENRKQGGPRTHHGKILALLAGLLHTPDGQQMLPTYTEKNNGKRYRYYVPYMEKRRSAGAT